MSGMVNQLSDLNMLYQTSTSGVFNESASADKTRKGAPDKTSDIKKVCCEFESIFLSQMLKEMRATIPKSELLPDSSAMNMFTSMLDTEIASKMSKSRGIGLAEIIERQIKETASK